jgi:small-conductance mechanosensitive channel
MKDRIESERKAQSLRRGTLKTLFYIVVLVVSLVAINFLFRWNSVEDIPPFLTPYGTLILTLNPYLLYIQAVLVFVFGYLTVKNISEMIYTHMRTRVDHPTAATLRTITRIAGIAVLLSVTASVFNVNPTAALTVGSFGGLVVGFATQTILSHIVAGVFLLLTRPFTFGDTITVSGQTGRVKEVKLMHLILEAEDGTKDILIPSGTVVTQIIQKRKSPKKERPVKTILTLDPPPNRITMGSTITFTGKLVKAESETPVIGSTVKLFDGDLERDDLIASGTSGSDGCFQVTWTAKKIERWDSTAEIYAKF